MFQRKVLPCKLPSWHDIYTGITKALILGLSWLSLTYWSDICEEVISNSVLLASISPVRHLLCGPLHYMKYAIMAQGSLLWLQLDQACFLILLYMMPVMLTGLNDLSQELFKDFLKDFGFISTAKQVFEHINTQVFRALTQAVEEWPLLQKKPKLSHNPVNGVLFVEMPRAAHKFSISNFSWAVLCMLDQLPINGTLLCTGLQANISMRSPLTGFSATPNLALVTSSVTRGPSIFLAVVECAFSQDCDDLMKKEGTQTWSFFSQLDVSFSEEKFLALPQSIEACAAKLNEPTSTSGSCSVNKPDSSLPLDPSISTKQSDAETDINSEAKLEPQPVEIKPIMVTGHMWCNIRDVQYHVWTKEDGAQRIDLDNSKRDVFSSSYIPTLKWERQNWAIRKGLSVVKKGISKLLSISTSKSAVHRLQAANLGVDFDQRVIQARVVASSRVTAWFALPRLVFQHILWNQACLFGC
ncbi:hypothetical protein EDC04DRAFT_2601280 [Pisolithus marmoratus]|nr:hypothetical protein EDC04DRAFT_2601280 [Pisolithus marmoratus]